MLPKYDSLLVADYNQLNVYQLILQSNEIRVLPMNPCQPVALAFDHRISVIYVLCEGRNTDQFEIHKKNFDDTVDKVIYYSPQRKSTTTIVFRPIVRRNCISSASL